MILEFFWVSIWLTWENVFLIFCVGELSIWIRRISSIEDIPNWVIFGKIFIFLGIHNKFCVFLEGEIVIIIQVSVIELILQIWFSEIWVCLLDLRTPFFIWELSFWVWGIHQVEVHLLWVLNDIILQGIFLCLVNSSSELLVVDEVVFISINFCKKFLKKSIFNVWLCFPDLNNPFFVW